MEATAYTGSTRWDELEVNRIPLGQPFTWLAKGWRDIGSAGIYSLRYGAAIVVISGLITWLVWSTDNLFLLPFLIAGFFYRRAAPGHRPLPDERPSGTGRTPLRLQRLSSMEAQPEPGFHGQHRVHHSDEHLAGGQRRPVRTPLQGSSPSLDNFFTKVFLSEAGFNFALASLVVGFLIAWCAYAISVITVPMLIDRKVDGFTAIRFSIKSVLGNMPAMMLWAGLIVFIVGLGMATFYLGLVIALPLIGHASWHAYRDLVPTGA
jgi:uncharacterized membrane protein